MASIEEIKYHLVWCTKYRHRLLYGDVAVELDAFLRRKQALYDFTIISLSIEADHVHLLFSVANSGVDVNKVVAKIKGGSSFFLRKRFRKLLSYPSLWSPSHFLATAGNISSQSITDYIEKQGILEEEIVKRAFVYKVFNPNKRKLHQLDTWLKDFTSRPKGLQCGYQKNYPSVICLRNDLIKVEAKNDKLWLTLPGGNGWKSITIGLLGRLLPLDAKLCDSKLVKKNNDYYAHLSIEQKRSVQKGSFDKTVGVDLGIVHPATKVLVVDDKIQAVKFYGKQIKNQLWKRSVRYRKLQKHKIKAQKRLARYTRSINDYVHKMTKEVARQCEKEGAVLVVGNLRGITKKWDIDQKKTSREFRRFAKPMPYGKAMSQLWYKATLSNVPVVFQNEAWSSKRCSRCGAMGTRRGDNFKCGACGYHTQADVNGAMNIALAYRRGREWLVPTAESVATQVATVPETHGL